MALAFATGPALGGLLIAGAGVEAAYAAFGVLVLGNLIGLAFVRPLREIGDRTPPSLRAVREGLAFVRREPDRARLHGARHVRGDPRRRDRAAAGLRDARSSRSDARGYGLLSSSLEIGALAMAVLLLMRPAIERAGPALLAAVAVYGLATLGFGLSRSFPLSVALYMLAGAADQVSVVLRATAVQLSTPDALRGRVSAVNMIFINASNQLGAVESGFLAAATSATFAVVFGGIGCLFVVAFTAWRLPELRRYRITSRTDSSEDRMEPDRSSNTAEYTAAMRADHLLHDADPVLEDAWALRLLEPRCARRSRRATITPCSRAPACARPRATS